MPLFKLAWVTSWLSVLLTCSQSLLKVPDGFATTWVGHPRSVLNWAREIRNPLQISSGVLSNPFRPRTTHLQANRGLEEIVSNQAQFQQKSANGRNFTGDVCLPGVRPEPFAPQIVATEVVTLPQPKLASLSLPDRLGQLFGPFRDKRQTSTESPNQATIVIAVSPQPKLALNRLYPMRIALGNKAVKAIRKNQSFQVWVNGQPIVQLSDRTQAELIVQRLQEVLSRADFDPLRIQPDLVGGKPAAMMDDRLLFVVNEATAVDREHNRELLAINWVNNLRKALNAPPLTLAEAQRHLYGLVATEREIEGWASWYGDYFHGRLTANGEVYDQHAFTAAHPYLPFNTYLKVTNLDSNDSAIVRINDRGPFVAPRSLDLSRGVARCINSEETGVVRYNATVMKPYSPVDNI
jgi:hypothetical protein